MPFAAQQAPLVPDRGGETTAGQVASLIASLWNIAQQKEEETHLAEQALEQLCRQGPWQHASLLQAQGGQWVRMAQAGSPAQVPEALVAQAAHAGQNLLRPPWTLVVKAPPGQSPLVLALFHQGELPAEWLPAAQALLEAWCTVWEQRKTRKQLALAQRLLQLSLNWNQQRSLPELFLQIAQAATELLDAERATIFLWDRKRGVLVGRPALGIKGGELTVPEGTGVVGRVIQENSPLVVHPDGDQSLINRQVDQQTGFHTRTVLCVPLRGKSGQPLGAFQVLNKRHGRFSPEDQHILEQLAQQAAVALSNAQDLEELLRFKQAVTDQAQQEVQLIGHSEAICALRNVVERVADTDLTVLLLGENGTGKEVVARMIHMRSSRRDRPLVAVNCAGIVPTLLESELFGHEKGAFTGAEERRIGKFELAHGGTLFLDEIAEMSLEGQAKLLRAIEYREITRVGGNQPLRVDVRIIAATNRDLAQAVREGKFRQDLFYRLNGVTLVLPPLRQRGEDILLLAEHFLQQFCSRIGRPMPHITPEAQQALLAHSWPGNVRELRNLMERLAYLGGDVIRPEDLNLLLPPEQQACGGVPAGLTLREATRQFQTQYILQTIRQCGGRMVEAAQRLGLHRANLYRKMRQLGMNRQEEE